MARFLLFAGCPKSRRMLAVPDLGGAACDALRQRAERRSPESHVAGAGGEEEGTGRRAGMCAEKVRQDVGDHLSEVRRQRGPGYREALLRISQGSCSHPSREPLLRTALEGTPKVEMAEFTATRWKGRLKGPACPAVFSVLRG